MIPKAALDYIKNKKLKTGFSYRDVWNEEHATNFTVAKAMQLDVLTDFKSAVEKALEEGQTLEQFKKNLKPTLQEKGWWGKKEMVDPLTGKTVNAQLGSDRRLKTIYDTNTRSAYQEGRWERTQASTAHPYLMYRVGPSAHHRKEHLSWDGLVLPKDDPWWNSHYPPNGWGCKCWTMAVSEARKERLEQTGITVPPSVDGRPGYTVPVKTKAPPIKYDNYYNERKGIVERVPTGVNPAFNWNVGRMGRQTPILQKTMKTVKEIIPDQYDALAKTLFTNKIAVEEYHDFIDNALSQKLDRHKTMPVGFIDSKIVNHIKTDKESSFIDLSDNNIILLEAGLPNAGKYSGRHIRQQNAPAESDWKNLVEYLLDASVFQDKSSLIFLRQVSELKYVKIAVDLNTQYNFKSSHGVKPFLPKVDSMYLIDISTERGNDAYNNILKLIKIK